jgi:tetratricopeptide (TPR) repeat protein
MSPSSICEDESRNLYVLDSSTGCITVFSPTDFLKKVHAALKLYHNGQYAQSVEPWREVLGIDNNYGIAHLGLGKAYERQEKWEAAEKEYRLAGSVTAYSRAFEGKRQLIFRTQFGWVLLAALALLALAVVLFRLGRRVVNRAS